MDIQEKKAFEKHASKFFTDSKEAFKTNGDQYLYDEVIWMWDCWLAAKAQAVPDGYCVVPKEPTPKMIDATWDYDGEIQEMSHNTRNEFIYKAMIEAQEQSHEH